MTTDTFTTWTNRIERQMNFDMDFLKSVKELRKSDLYENDERIKRVLIVGFVEFNNRILGDGGFYEKEIQKLIDKVTENGKIKIRKERCFSIQKLQVKSQIIQGTLKQIAEMK